MNWQVEYTPWAVEDLRGFSLCARTLVYGWIERHLAGGANPRRWGKGDQDGGRWRYRVGEYRLIAEIEAERIVILNVNLGLRGATSLGVEIPETAVRRGRQSWRAPNTFIRSGGR